MIRGGILDGGRKRPSAEKDDELTVTQEMEFKSQQQSGGIRICPYQHWSDFFPDGWR
jgi:hypothetical protein